MGTWIIAFFKDINGIVNNENLQLTDSETDTFLSGLMKEKSIFSIFKTLPIKKKEIREFFNVGAIKSFIDMKKFLLKNNKKRDGTHTTIKFDPTNKDDKRVVSFNQENNAPYFRTSVDGKIINNGANLSYAEADMVYKRVFSIRKKDAFTDFLNTLLLE